MAIRVDHGDRGPLTAEERYPAQLAAFRAAFPGTKHIVLGTPSYQAPGLYYQKYFARRGLLIERQRLGRIHLRPGDTILTSEEQIERVLRDDYDTEKIFSFEGMEGAVVISRHRGGAAA